VKKIIAVISLAAMGLFVAAPAAAFSFNVQRVIDDSLAKVRASRLVKVNVDNVNDAVVKNDVEAEADAGDNKIKSDDDMTTALITTGNSSATAGTNSTVNLNDTEEELEPAEGSTLVADVKDDSKVNTEADEELNNVIDNDNWVNIDDDVDADADTGDNKIDSGDSLTGGTIGAGGATSAANAVKILNSNIKLIRIMRPMIPFGSGPTL